ncbi:MAG TPA: tandem-95 repeat protein [Candidatus Nanoarchaeia archaeon]|nr:tandem-95 repeat protein [Candidatus Nanoarchaeia archaeon]
MRKKSRVILAIVSLSILIALSSQFMAFTFSPLLPSIFNLSEDVGFYYDINVTANESFVNFSMEQTPYPNLTINPQTGVLEFTPKNNEVGVSGFFLVIVRNTSNPGADFITSNIRFNISNVNDAPNITSFYPAQTTISIIENQTQHFNFTASDPDTIHGDAVNQSWFLNGTLVSQNNTFNFTPTYCQSGFYNITLIVNDTSSENTVLTWNLTVNNSNRAPTFNSTILNVTWSEDTNVLNNFTLSGIVNDLDNLECSGENFDNITYSSVGNSSITVTINLTSTNVSFYPRSNFFGTEAVYFTASDSRNSTFSNNITLNVTNVNDAPLFNYSNQTVVASVPFVYDINATDPDNDVQAGINIVSYYDNSTVFNINSSNGVINFTANLSIVGYYAVNISVDDGFVNVSALVFFNITADNAPNMSFIGDQNATEGILFSLNVTALDIDNDSITFSTNYSALSVSVINSTTSNLSFTPTNNDVGNHTVLVTVTDIFGATDTETIRLEVFNVNNAPNLTFIQNQTARISKSFQIFVSASDLDNDNLTFFDNSTFFNISYFNITTGKINFTPSQAQEGNYSVNISVTDNFYNVTQTVYFFLVNNSAPVLFGIGNFTFAEDSLFTLRINATDSNQEDLSFSSNSSIFNLTIVNSTSVLINFTPTQQNVGIHWINFTVNDTTDIDWELVYFNITELNESPYFNPSIPILNATVGTQFFYDLNATDEEGDTLTFFSNSTVFNVSNSSGIINFTPVSGNVGNYTVNFSVTDGNVANYSVVSFKVININRPPSIDSFYPASQNQSVAEGSEIQFNVTASDPDGSLLSYSWQLNGSEQNTTYSFLYRPGFSSSGFYNLTVIVSDGVLSNSTSWNLTVNNTNRPIVYGISNKTTEDDFESGTLSGVNLTVQSGNITLAKSDGTSYFAEGNFTSSVIDLGSSTNITLTNLTWIENRPQNTTIIFQLRTSPDNVTFTNFTGNSTSNYTNPNGSVITGQSDRYIQFKAILATNNLSVAPVVEQVVINYKISDFEGKEDTVYLNYFDLDNFFRDPDSDAVTYSASEVSSISVSIDSQHRVSLTPNSDFAGSRNVVFYASDGIVNISSNNITLNFADVEEPSSVVIQSSSSGGGGGGGTKFVYVNRSIIINQSKSFELIVPENIRVGVDEDIIVPISVQNGNDYEINGVQIAAFSNITDLEMYFTDSYIKSIPPFQNAKSELRISGYNTSKTFNVKIVANVTSPSLSDSAIVNINILDNLSEEIRYVRDFIRLNPECLELNEVLIEASKELQKGNNERAAVILDKAVDACKYLTSGKRPDTQKTSGELSPYLKLLKNRYFVSVGALAIFSLFLVVSYMLYNRWKWY